MVSFQRIVLALFLSSAPFAVAATTPQSIVPDNIILCQANAGCVHKDLLGRSYQVLSTPRFIVMVSVSREGSYTRADVSVSNNTGLPLNLNPDDFRIEELTPKFRVLSYIAPADLKKIAPSPAIPAPLSEEVAAATVSSAPRLIEASATQNGGRDETFAADHKREALQEAYDRAIAQQHLAAVSIAPNEVARGRVYFQRDKHAQAMNLVLPVAGMVFEFPYQPQN